MRAVVAILTRNIVIKGDDTDNWGCHILSGGFSEQSPNDPAITYYRRGDV